jgi:hypothetical protein
MEIRKHLSYANVIATTALFVALGGSAYAVSEITSGDIKNESIRSADLRNRKAVKGADVRRDALGGKEIAEQSLNSSRFAPMTGSAPGACNPESSTFLDCASVTINLQRASRVLVIATGGQRSEGGPAKAECQLRVDDEATALGSNPGEEATDNTSGGATNGFARTLVTPNPIPAGSHRVALACSEVSADVRIENPTIAAIAIATK